VVRALARAASSRAGPSDRAGPGRCDTRGEREFWSVALALDDIGVGSGLVDRLV